jgi:hypothetical protein
MLYLVELYLTREDERWWWNCLNQRFAKIDKCEIVEYDKNVPTLDEHSI